MRFDRIEIQNFRSFPPEKTTITFPEHENLLVCVGANNAGKSNLLDALRLVLAGTRRFSPEPADFHQLDLGREIRIDLHLREPLARENVFHKLDLIHGVFLRVWRSEHGGDRGQLKTEHYCFTADGSTYVPPAAAGKRKGALTEDVAPIRWLPASATRVVSQLGRIHYLTPSLYRAFDTGGYGVLAQLLDLYREDFRSDENKYTLPGGEVVSRADAYDRFAHRLSEILRTDKLAYIEQSLSANLRTILGPTAAGASVSIGLPSAEELLAEVLSLTVQDDVASPMLSVDRLGAGYRSLLRLAVLRTYAEVAEDTRPAVFLVEEPEAYLNPHLRRYFSATLNMLAARGNDVVVTTHDTAFVSLPAYRTVLRVAKINGRTQGFRCVDTLDFSYERLAQKLRRGGNGEVLFAARAILCEGQDDVAAVRALLGELGIDADSLNISVVDCGGRDQLPDYVRLLDVLDVEVVVITDGDASKLKKHDDDTRKKVEAVAAVAGERAFRFAEDIESALGVEKQRDNAAQLVRVIEQLNVLDLPGDHEISRLAERLLAFCSPSTPSDTTVSEATPAP